MNPAVPAPSQTSWLERVLGPRRPDILRELDPVVIMGRGHSGTRILSWFCAHLGVDLAVRADRPAGDSDKRFTRVLQHLACVQVNSPSQVSPTALTQFQAAVHAYYNRIDPGEG